MANHRAVKLYEATFRYQRKRRRPMTYTNLTQHNLTTQLYLKFFRFAQHEVKRQKGRMTEQRTANVKMSRTVEVV